MKILKKVKKILIWVLAIIFFSFVMAMTVLMLNINKYGVTQFDDKSLIVIRSDISNEKYNKGDLVIVESRTLNKIAVSDEVFAYKVNSDGSVNIDLGTVGQVQEDQETIVFENGSAYGIDYVIGEASEVYEDIGTYLGVVQSKWGFLFIILVPCFLVFIYQLYNLIIEIKYGKDEEETK